MRRSRHRSPAAQGRTARTTPGRPAAPRPTAVPAAGSPAAAGTRARRAPHAGPSLGAPPQAMAPRQSRGGPDLPRELRGAVDERLDGVAGLVVAVLDGGRLHEVRGGGQHRAADPTVLGDLRRPDRVDDDPGRVRRVPDLELVL